MDDNISIENKVSDLKLYICKVIKGPMVLQHLLCFISPADATDIKNDYDRYNYERATNVLLGKIIESPHPGKWQAFVEALENSGYPYLVSLLNKKGEKLEDYRHQKVIIQIFAPYLASLVEPLSLLGHLKYADLIDTLDEQEIFSCANCEGATAATMLMLDRIQCRQPPSKWFLDFLKILFINGHESIVMEMEPDFSIDCQVLKQDSVVSGNIGKEENNSEESLTENIIEARLDNFRQEILELVSLRKIAANLSHYLLPTHVIMRLSQLSKDSNKEGMESLLEEIGKMDIPNKWGLFVTCLKESDYSYIAGILTRTCEKGTHYRERNLIKIFTPALQNQLEPQDLVSHLLADNVINDTDRDQILFKYRCSGSIAASIALLDCMQCRLSPEEWYPSFLNALIKCGRIDLVETVDPDFLYRSERKDKILDQVQEPASIQSPYIRLEYAYGKVLKMERSAKQALAKLRQKFEKMEDEALTEIQNASAKLIDYLLETNEKIQSMAPDNYDSIMELENYIDKSLNSFDKKEFKFVPNKDVISLQKLGSIDQTTRGHRRNPRIVRDRPESPCIAYRDKRHGLYRHRSSSSGSTESSGFIHINGRNEISTRLSNVQTIPVTEKGGQYDKSKEIQGYTLANDNTCSISFTRQESVSTIYTDSLSVSSLEEMSTSADQLISQNSETPNIHDINRSRSFANFLNYRTIAVPSVREDYMLSNLCMYATNK